MWLFVFAYIEYLLSGLLSCLPVCLLDFLFAVMLACLFDWLVGWLVACLLGNLPGFVAGLFNTRWLTWLLAGLWLPV